MFRLFATLHREYTQFTRGDLVLNFCHALFCIILHFMTSSLECAQVIGLRLEIQTISKVNHVSYLHDFRALTCAPLYVYNGIRSIVGFCKHVGHHVEVMWIAHARFTGGLPCIACTQPAHTNAPWWHLKWCSSRRSQIKNRLARSTWIYNKGDPC